MNADILVTYAMSVPAILLAVAVHEFTKALTSTILGDTAPKTTEG